MHSVPAPLNSNTVAAAAAAAARRRSRADVRPDAALPSGCFTVSKIGPVSAPAYFGRGQTILLQRERIKRQTIAQRRLRQAA